MGRVSDTREKLIASATDLIYASSYANVGVQELCEHAGVKKGSFYHFFPSKSKLTLAALERQWASRQRDIMAPAFSKSLRPLQRIERYLDSIYMHQCGVKERTGQVSGCPFGNLALELSTQDEAIRKKVDNIFREITAYLEDAIRDAVAAGEMREQNVKATAQSMLALIEGTILLAKTRNDLEPIKQLRERVLAPFL